MISKLNKRTKVRESSWFRARRLKTRWKVGLDRSKWRVLKRMISRWLRN